MRGTIAGLLVFLALGARAEEAPRKSIMDMGYIELAESGKISGLLPLPGSFAVKKRLADSVNAMLKGSFEFSRDENKAKVKEKLDFLMGEIVRHAADDPYDLNHVVGFQRQLGSAWGNFREAYAGEAQASAFRKAVDQFYEAAEEWSAHAEALTKVHVWKAAKGARCLGEKEKAQ